MTLKFIIVGFCWLHVSYAFAQNPTDSSSNPLPELVVRSYPGQQPILTLPASVTYIDRLNTDHFPSFTPVPLLNSVAGVRMEERSPGSYRLSIRGSLIRSPFGVRNIKIYLDEFSLTDAGGNTYLNMIDLSSISNIEILKGPDGSLFGANTGGVVLLNTTQKNDSSHFSASLTGGSYGLFYQAATIQKQTSRYFFSLKEAYQRSDGFREHSALSKRYIHSTQRLKYLKAGELSLLLLYSQLNYETPGGLTKSQWDQNPKQARPATAKLHGAAEQQSSVDNRTFFTGLSNEISLSPRLRQVSAVNLTETFFENPFITTFEKRNERTVGFRGYFELKLRQTDVFNLNFYAGGEWQNTSSSIRNFGNNYGQQDSLQSAHIVDARQFFYFARSVFVLYNRLTVEAALSINHYLNIYKPSPPATYSGRTFNPQFSPRFALSYQLTSAFVLRGIISRGFSPPSVQEIRASDQTINTSIDAEQTLNYETGIRYQDRSRRIRADVSFFYNNLKNAIVRKLNDDGEEYFSNAGRTRQAGLECELTGWVLKQRQTGFFQGIKITSAYTLNDFVYTEYSIATENYGGKSIAGVPHQTFSAGINSYFAQNCYLFIQTYMAGKIPLNDANSIYAASYNVTQVKVGKKLKLTDLFAGIDNIFNEKYSLGNDLNAAGGRYFNSAPMRNFYAGIRFTY